LGSTREELTFLSAERQKKYISLEICQKGFNKDLFLRSVISIFQVSNFNKKSKNSRLFSRLGIQKPQGFFLRLSLLWFCGALQRTGGAFRVGFGKNMFLVYLLGKYNKQNK